MAVAVEIGDNDAIDRGQLGQSRQRAELEGAVGLLEEDAAGEFGGGEARGRLQTLGRENVFHRRP